VGLKTRTSYIFLRFQTTGPAQAKPTPDLTPDRIPQRGRANHEVNEDFPTSQSSIFSRCSDEWSSIGHWIISIFMKHQSYKCGSSSFIRISVRYEMELILSSGLQRYNYGNQLATRNRVEYKSFPKRETTLNNEGHKIRLPL